MFRPNQSARAIARCAAALDQFLIRHHLDQRRAIVARRGLLEGRVELVRVVDAHTQHATPERVVVADEAPALEGCQHGGTERPLWWRSVVVQSAVLAVVVRQAERLGADGDCLDAPRGSSSSSSTLCQVSSTGICVIKHSESCHEARS